MTTFPERWKIYQQKYSKKAKPLQRCVVLKRKENINFPVVFKIFFQIRVHSVIYTADNVLTPEVITNNLWILSMMTFGGFDDLVRF